MISKDFRGRELEEAFVRFLVTAAHAGERADKKGIDIVFKLLETAFMVIQVKSTIEHAIEHADNGLRLDNRLVPVVIGDPSFAQKETCINALLTAGYWIAPCTMDLSRKLELEEIYLTNNHRLVRPRSRDAIIALL